MDLISKDDVECFIPPHDKEYNPFKAYANGWDIFGTVREWELSILDGKIALTNNVGAEYNVGELTKSAIRCSIAFHQHKTPVIVISYVDGETVIYTYDLQTQDLNTVTVLSGYKDATILYARGYSKRKLLLVALQNNKVLHLDVCIVDKVVDVRSVEETPLTGVSIHRVGLTPSYAVRVELVS